MIHDVLECLPVYVREDITLQRLHCECLLQACIAHRAEPFGCVVADFFPHRFQFHKGFRRILSEEGLWFTLEALEPDFLRTHNVHKRAVDTAVTAFHVPHVVVAGQRRKRVEDAIVGPGIVCMKQLEFGKSHGEVPRIE